VLVQVTRNKLRSWAGTLMPGYKKLIAARQRIADLEAELQVAWNRFGAEHERANAAAADGRHAWNLVGSTQQRVDELFADGRHAWNLVGSTQQRVDELFAENQRLWGENARLLAGASAQSVSPHTAIGMEVALQGLKDRGFAPHLVVDAGAAVGAWTADAARIWPEGRFAMVEALEERREQLEQLRTDSGVAMDIFICGLADKDGELQMGVSKFLFDSSFAYKCASTRAVPVVTLDNLMERNGLGAPDFIKIDVQGFELNVLQGSERSLSTCAVVLVECNFRRFSPAMPTVTEVTTWMDQRGYMPYEIVEVLRRPLDGAMGQCDIMFVRKDHELVANNSWA
jgi:FkbM family methyltransferase